MDKNLNVSSDCVRVRFAPSPTGFGGLHCGGIRTALYNYLFAKKMGGKFILRIEDTDSTRFCETAEQNFNDAFDWLGIGFDESPSKGGNYGPYRQSERKDIYKQYYKDLVDKGLAYYAFDTAEELDIVRNEIENFSYNFDTRNSMKNSLTLSQDEVDKLLNETNDWVVRIKYPDTPIIIEVDDMICGKVSVNTSTLDDKVIWKKKDELPTYHLANIVDDHLMKITHVIRGKEWLPSAPLHVYLYMCFGWDAPLFAHLPLIMGPNGKLSKRDGDKYGFSVYPIGFTNTETGQYIKGYKDDGFLPSAVNNFLAFIGWNPGTEKEVYTMDELIQDFDLSKVNKASGKFNIEKANWFNGQHLKLTDTNVLVSDFKKLLNDKDITLSDTATFKVLESYKNKVNFLKDIITETSYLFNKPSDYDQKVMKKMKDSTNDILVLLYNEFKTVSAEYWFEENLQLTFENFVVKNRLKFGDVAPFMRLLLTGKGNGPSLFFIMDLLGKTTTIERLGDYDKLNKNLELV